MIKLNPKYGGFKESEEGVILGEELYTEESLEEEYSSTLYRISQIEEEMKEGKDNDEKIKLLGERKEYLDGISKLLKHKYTEKMKNLEFYLKSELENIDKNPSITKKNILHLEAIIKQLEEKIIELQ